MPYNRHVTRHHGRSLTRACLRTLPGCPRRLVHLAHALAAFRRAISCHRRLARLAPEFFDSAVVEREAREREERRRWMASWEPALRKAYGPATASTPAADMDLDLPRLPGLRTQWAVELQLAGWTFWMAAGRVAFRRHQHCRPHALLSLAQLARLLQLAQDFGCLATGLGPDPPVPAVANLGNQCLADLERAYGMDRHPLA